MNHALSAAFLVAPKSQTRGSPFVSNGAFFRLNAFLVFSQESLCYVSLVMLCCAVLWLLWQWRGCLSMLRVRDQALERARELLIDANRERDEIWLDYEQMRSDLKDKQRELERTSRMMRLVLDNIPVRVFWKNRALVYQDGNRAFLKDARIKHPDDLIGLDDFDMPWRHLAEKYRADDYSIIESLTAKVDCEEPYTTKGGRKIWLRYSKIPMRDANGKVVGLLTTYENITRRKRTEVAYKESQSRLAQANQMMKLVLDHIPARVFWKDRDLNYLGGNRLFLEDAGLQRLDDLIGGSDHDMVWVSEASRFRADEREILERRMPRLNYEESQTTPEGLRWVTISKIPLLDVRSEIQGILGIYEDITERKRVVGELSRLRNLLGATVNAMPSVLVGVDDRGRVNLWNREAARATHLPNSEALGAPLVEVFPLMGQAWDKVERAMSECQAQRGELLESREDGEVRHLELAVYPLKMEGLEGAVLRLDDISERVRIQEMMIQSEKMMSVGGLAAGMAHEINNPLAGIIQCVQVMRNRVSEQMERNRNEASMCGTSMEAISAYMERRGVLKMLEAISASSSRAAKIVGNMLSFSRKGSSLLEPHDLRLLLDQTIDIASNDFDLKRNFDFRNIAIERDYSKDMPLILCEASKIQQVFLNILKNGAEAMAEWADRRASERPRFFLQIDHDHRMAHVVIEDNGPGMDKSTRKRIFEPFFTTKPVGVGTGLGLSVSYFIITENHGGSLSVTSAPGKGTRFTIGLPLVKESA